MEIKFRHFSNRFQKDNKRTKQYWICHSERQSAWRRTSYKTFPVSSESSVGLRQSLNVTRSFRVDGKADFLTFTRQMKSWKHQLLLLWGSKKWWLIYSKSSYFLWLLIHPSFIWSFYATRDTGICQIYVFPILYLIFVRRFSATLNAWGTSRTMIYRDETLVKKAAMTSVLQRTVSFLIPKLHLLEFSTSFAEWTVLTLETLHL